MGTHIRLAVLLILIAVLLHAQEAPPSPSKPVIMPADSRLKVDMAKLQTARPMLEAEHSYTLPELIDIAEQHNPETRVLWERAKQRAESIGIARSSLFPVIAAVASASRNQYSLFVDRFYHQDLNTFPIALTLNYTLFDAGSRAARIDQAKANLLAADYMFNDAHRRIVFQVVDSYYRLLDALNQRVASQASLKDAETVQAAVEARLANGLATLPDVLEARATTAQARFDLASIQGMVATARGTLASVLGASPAADFNVEDISGRTLPEAIQEPVQALLDRAVTQRPDLLAQAARIQASEADLKQARALFYPVVSVSGDYGHRNSLAQSNYGPLLTSRIFPYDAQVQINWNLFDGGNRRKEMGRAQEARKEAESQVAQSRNQIESEIWAAYVRLKTAGDQQEAAEAQELAAEQSYSAAQEAFQAGVRTFIDLTTAQRSLARARTNRASARVRVLFGLADLAFRVGDPMVTEK